MTLSPAVEINIREMIKKAFFFLILTLTHFIQTNKVHLQLKAKHNFLLEAIGIASHSSRWIKWTEPISSGELCVLSVCSEFKAAWSENKGAALLIQASGGSKKIRTKKNLFTVCRCWWILLWDFVSSNESGNHPLLSQTTISTQKALSSCCSFVNSVHKNKVWKRAPPLKTSNLWK